MLLATPSQKYKEIPEVEKGACQLPLDLFNELGRCSTEETLSLVIYDIYRI